MRIRRPRRPALWGLAGVLAGAAVLGVLAAAGSRRLRTVEVTGESMLPVLAPGDWLVVRRGARPVPGALVIAEHPGRPGLLIVKRAAHREPGGWWLESDNQRAPGRQDSWDFGAVPDALVAGRVVARYRPPSGAGTVTRGLFGWRAAAALGRPAQRSQQ